MMDLFTLDQLARDHHRELLEVARIERLLRQRQEDVPGLRDRLLLAGGNALIALGQRLGAYAHRELIVPCEGAYPIKTALPRP